MHALSLTSKISVIILIAILTACGGGNKSLLSDDEQIDFACATLCKVNDKCPLEVTILNPWDSASVLQNITIQKPFRRIVVGTEVHQGLFNMLGFTGEMLLIDEMNPNIESIIAFKPEAIFISPFPNGDYARLESIGIPVVRCADYMEPSPLARAEWMRLYGRMLGVAEQSDSLFNQIFHDYNQLKDKASLTTTTPSILTDIAYGQSWYQPLSESTIGSLYHDAHCSTPFDSLAGQGSATLSIEEVVFNSANVDYWLIRYAQDSELSLSQLTAMHPLYGKVGALNKQQVWGTNTNKSRYFIELPFRPDLHLKEILSIVHPEVMGEPSAYYHRIR